VESMEAAAQEPWRGGESMPRRSRPLNNEAWGVSGGNRSGTASRADIVPGHPLGWVKRRRTQRAPRIPNGAGSSGADGGEAGLSSQSSKRISSRAVMDFVRRKAATQALESDPCSRKLCR